MEKRERFQGVDVGGLQLQASLEAQHNFGLIFSRRRGLSRAGPLLPQVHSQLKMGAMRRALQTKVRGKRQQHQGKNMMKMKAKGAQKKQVLCESPTSTRSMSVKVESMVTHLRCCSFAEIETGVLWRAVGRCSVRDRALQQRIAVLGVYLQRLVDV